MYQDYLPKPNPLRAAINEVYHADETEIVRSLLGQNPISPAQKKAIDKSAFALVEQVRKSKHGHGGLDAFLHQYELSSKEGVVLMCLAEALLRTPDSKTANRLIRDKLAGADWEQYLGSSDSLFVNASTWALMLTGRVIGGAEPTTGDVKGLLQKLITRSGEPIIRQAVTQAMRILGRQFVMGRNIGEALERALDTEAKGYTYSYDMLGEAARTAADAERYLQAYLTAIHAIGKASNGKGPILGPGISIKLSALHPRYEFRHRDRVLSELAPRLKQLALAAKDYDINLCVDAEEADRLDLSLDIIEQVFSDPELGAWNGFGLAVQAYQKRAPQVIDWLAELARKQGKRLMVRLVKGAYWDTEIKQAQEKGLDGYPVFTRKTSTDVSYIVCAAKLLEAGDNFFPQFATHNAHTAATVLELAKGRTDFEFQRLHGMGDPLFDQLVSKDGKGSACRVYAPVGSHEDLLAYLVRRLLENGANSSFVNRIVDEKLPIEEIIADPISKTVAIQGTPHPRIPLPTSLYGIERKNSHGFELSNWAELDAIGNSIGDWIRKGWSAFPIIAGNHHGDKTSTVRNPADTRQITGQVVEATGQMADEALASAHGFAAEWDATPASDRAGILEACADLLQENSAELMALCIAEAGKTLDDAQAELREAIDFCRYYAMNARNQFAEPMVMPGPTGETNSLSLHGRGVFVCISPWNFPLAIFIGQVTAALAAGNTVIAKPAEQTPLIAFRAVQLLHQAGVPTEALHLVPGDGATIGAKLVSDQRTDGVAFTGSTETAQLINRTLAAREGAIVPLIAETGGQNTMIVDSTALPEQVVADIVDSAFQSAGQRCSALRVLFVQEDIADHLIEMLIGAMQELTVGMPESLATDVGPVIDAEARNILEQHCLKMEREATLLHRVSLSGDTANGYFFAPTAFELDSIHQLKREVFGPILHLIRYSADNLDQIIDEINATNYGLTLGIHSRIDNTVNYISERLRVGNTYVNRNQIGAIVGVQPFGGQRLSGTGPKAGGPHYLYRFATEKTLTINTTAAGGNASLISLEDSSEDQP